MTMSDYPHQYDYLGHQPGCGVCAKERHERAVKIRRERAERETLKADLKILIEYNHYQESFTYKTGDRFDPSVFAARMMSLGFRMLDIVNED